MHTYSTAESVGAVVDDEYRCVQVILWNRDAFVPYNITHTESGLSMAWTIADQFLQQQLAARVVQLVTPKSPDGWVMRYLGEVT